MSFTVGRPGLDYNTSDTTSLWFEGFSGEVVLAYEKNVKLMDKITVRMLPKGQKSLSYPVIHTGAGKYHTPGDDLLEDAGYANSFRQGNRDIYADKAFISTALVDDNDNQLTAYDARIPYASQLGGKVAAHMDYQVMRCISTNANSGATALYTGAAVGNQVTAANAATQANTLINSMLDLQAKFDNAGVPEEDRYIIISPTSRALLLKADSNNSFVHLDRDYNGVTSENGSVERGVVGSVAGFKVIVHNNLPATNDTDTANKLGSSEGNSYSISNTTLVALAFQREAIVAAVAKPISTEQHYIPEKNGTMLKAGAMIGFGAVRPEGLGKIVTS